MDFTAPPWLHEFGRIMLRLLPGGVFTAWCLWAVNWRKMWPVLAAGAWVPMVLVGIMAAVVWTHVFPSNVLVLGFIPVANGLWQLGAVAVLIGVALTCGWLQTRYGWYPPDISFDPPPPVPLHDHVHADDHSHAAPAPSHATH